MNGWSEVRESKLRVSAAREMKREDEEYKLEQKQRTYREIFPNDLVNVLERLLSHPMTRWEQTN